jgi:uncharacterized protein
LHFLVYYNNIHKMIDSDKIEGFEWDAGNARKNEKHGVTQADTEQVFLNEPLFVTPDEKHSESERRYRALGKTKNGRLLTVIFTLRQNNSLIRVISARDMNTKERRLYEQEAETNPQI